MRILFIAHRLPYPPNKGDKIRSFWELKTIAQRHEVDLFCFYDDPRDHHHIQELRRYCRKCYAEPLASHRGRVRALSAFLRRQSVSKGFFYSQTMARRIRESVRSRSYDLAFVFSSSMAQYTEDWPALPKILDLVDVDSDKWTQYASRTRGLRSWFWTSEGSRLAEYEYAVVNSFSNTLVCTDAEAQLLRSRVPTGNISVLQNWLDVDHYDPSTVEIPAELQALQPYVVFTGSMDYFPNVDAVQFFCREIMPAIHSKLPNLRFVIAGRNPPPAVTRLGTNPLVRVTGTVPDIRPYLRGAAAAVAPIRIARGVQTKILEALAMGTPVVASSAAACALPSQLASLLVVEDESDAFAASLVGLVQGSSSRRLATHAALLSYMESLQLPKLLESFLAEAVGTTAKAAFRKKAGLTRVISTLN